MHKNYTDINSETNYSKMSTYVVFFTRLNWSSALKQHPPLTTADTIMKNNHIIVGYGRVFLPLPDRYRYCTAIRAAGGPVRRNHWFGRPWGGATAGLLPGRGRVGSAGIAAATPPQTIRRSHHTSPTSRSVLWCLGNVFIKLYCF